MKKLIIKTKKRSDNLLLTLGFDAESIVAQKDGLVFVNIQTSDTPSLLIGRHGEGLDALQHVLRLLLLKDTVEHNTNIVLDIAGYRSSRTERIKKIARDKALMVMTTGIEETLFPMSSYERRVVHIVCKNIADVETESAGEGKERRVKIKPKR